MLRKIRIAAALLFFVSITLLLLDFTGTLHGWLGWMAKVQFLPALLALNFGVVLSLVVLTLLFGRVYCSVICPLGVWQDLVSRIAARRRKGRFGYAPALPWVRYGALALFVGAVVAGASSLAGLIEPYSAYGRIVTSLFAPLYRLGNNLLAWLAARVDSYAFYSAEVWVGSAVTLGVALVTLIVVSLWAWRSGRAYCNTVCPVGTLLGLASRFSLFKPRIDTGKCNGCRLCARNCKASCIDPQAHRIDYSRCVACMDCIDRCRQGAIRYTLRFGTKDASPRKATSGKTDSRKTGTQTAFAAAASNSASVSSAFSSASDPSRRRFLAGVALLTYAAVRAQEKKVGGGLARIEKKKAPNRLAPITPPGSQGAWHLAAHCTACQLCVSACPTQVLRPSSKLQTLMQPEVSYERGYCRPECTRCGEVCPAGAIHPITEVEKSSLQIGHAVWVWDNCIVNSDDVSCGNCARHCPTGAIQMVPRSANDPEGAQIPVVDQERCIGCGACENLCPARPFSAIYVEGHTRHRII